MADIIKRDGQELTIQVKVKLSGSLMEIENSILDACNEVGCLATAEALQRFDADGSPILVGNVKMTSKGLHSQTYQTPYGSVLIKRHTYQSSKGGGIYCPLEEKARIIRRATPKFAQQIAHKYSNMNAPAVRCDLIDNHHRTVAHSYLQDVSEYVAAIAQAKEEVWEYALPELDNAVSTVAIGLDGAHILIRDEGWRESMVGNISLYDLDGERLHTIYIGEAPEHGKETFLQRLEQEIQKIKQYYPNVHYLGIADGAKSNWSFLEQHTDKQLLDFYHVTEYLSQVAYAAYPGKTDKPKREKWLKTRCHQLKHDPGATDRLIDEMDKLSAKTRLTKTIKDNLSAALTYTSAPLSTGFKNHRHMMDYPTQVDNNQPIGSGVTEAACKTLVKQRLCGSGMRWKQTGAKVILSLRALVQSKGRWQQFWEKIDQFGARVCLEGTSY